MPQHRRLRGLEMTGSDRPVRVFVDHGEAYGNLGDEAMLLNALRRLRSHLGDCVFVLPREGTRPLPALSDYAIEEVPSPFTFFCAVNQMLARGRGHLRRLRLPLAAGVPPAHTAAACSALLRLKRSGGASLVGGDLRPMIDALARCDVFYGVGAADFNDFNAVGAAYKAWLYIAVRPFVSVSAASAQGFGPLERMDLRRLMARAFDKLDLLSFRDHAFSEQYTRSLGPLSCRSKVTADEALTLPAADAARRNEYLRSAGLAAGEEFVAVHWRATDYTQETEKFYSRVAAAFDTAIEETGLRLVFFPMSYDVHSRHDDACCSAVRGQMARPQNLLMAPVVKDVSLVKAGIGTARFTLGLSYHVHVFALSQGKPAVILFTGDYYRYKSHGLVDFYGPPCRAIDLAQAPPEELRDAVQTVNAQHAHAGRHIAAVNRQLLAVNDWTMCEIARLLRERRRLQ